MKFNSSYSYFKKKTTKLKVKQSIEGKSLIIFVLELKKNLFKKRSVLLKANEKNFDESVQVSLKKRAEKESQKVSLLLDEKVQIQRNLLQIVEQHQQRLIKEVYKPLDLSIETNYQAAQVFNEISEPQAVGNTKKTSSSIMKQAQVGNISSSLSSVSSNELSKSEDNLLKTTVDPQIRENSNSRSASPRPPLLTFSTEDFGTNNGKNSQKVSPRKRASLADEPAIDPNEPVYCYCKQVSWGEMVACDGPNCSREWFHLACVNLTSPPEGKWYCNDCKNKIK